MMNDSVREELIPKKKPHFKTNPVPPKARPLPPEQPVKNGPKTSARFSKPIFENKPLIEKTPVAESKAASELKPVARKSVTAKLDVKHTSPTLIEFQNKENALPEWRLELKNAVRQKLQRSQKNDDDQELFPTPRVINRTVGATALKSEIVEDIEEQPVLHENPTVQNALLRIEQSRQKFYPVSGTAAEEEPAAAQRKPKKDFPYYIASRSNELDVPKTEIKTVPYTVAKPKLISSIPAENFKRDTNKLPPLPKPAKVSTSFDKEPEIEIKDEVSLSAEQPAASSILSDITISPQKSSDFIEAEDTEIEENEDLAPFAMRFNAGLFDLIIGGFASLILLAPFVLLGGEWFTTAGLLAFLATCSIVMFIYMTSAVGMFGKTFGMKMFSLEIIDIEENDYPTFHQAAVSAAVYLLSLALGGSGFLTVLFTDEKRAVHDIVSGTLMVRDYQEEAA